MNDEMTNLDQAPEDFIIRHHAVARLACCKVRAISREGSPDLARVAEVVCLQAPLIRLGAREFPRERSTTSAGAQQVKRLRNENHQPPHAALVGRFSSRSRRTRSALAGSS
jgi:hypothetical protein